MAAPSPVIASLSWMPSRIALVLRDSRRASQRRHCACRLVLRSAPRHDKMHQGEKEAPVGSKTPLFVRPGARGGLTHKIVLKDIGLHKVQQHHRQPFIAKNSVEEH